MEVVDCSRIGIGYTPARAAGEDVNRCGLLPDRDRLHFRFPPGAVTLELWIAPGSGSVTLALGVEQHLNTLWIAPGSGSVTLGVDWVQQIDLLWIAPGSGSVTLQSWSVSFTHSVVDCSRIGIGYTRPLDEILSIAVDDGTAVTRPLP